MVKVFSITFGLALLSLAAYGRWFYEYPPIPVEQWGMGKSDQTISELSTEQLRKKDVESDYDYFARLTTTVNQYMIHFWPRDVTQRHAYGTDIPIFENYLLWLLGHIDARFSGIHEYLEPDRALHRGYGLCSQHSLIITNILNQEGYHSRLILLSGHIVSTVRDSKGHWSVLDGDYGVFIPHSLQYLEENSQEIDRYYQDAFLGIPARVQLPMEQLYASSDNNRIVKTIDKVGAKGYWIIILSMYGIWLIPLLLIILPLIKVRR